MLEITIRENEAGQRLDKYLHKYLKEAPGSFLYKMLRKKNITLNGGKASGKEILYTGDTLKLFMAEETIAKFGGSINTSHTVPDTSFPKKGVHNHCEQYYKAYEKYGKPDVIFENKHVLIINKPAGILTQKAAPEDLSLNEWFIGYLLKAGSITAEELHTFKPSVCNRLDRNTSGMVICSKTLAGSQEMSRIIKDRSLHKYYRLFVKGTLREASLLKGYLIKDEWKNTVRISENAPEASYIETKYQPIKNYRDITLMEAELITGKTHQIRLHFSGIGHPLLGDYKYGDRKLNDRYKKRYQVENQLLHAYRLEFPVMESDFEDMSGLVLTAKEPEIFRILEADCDLKF